MLLYFSISTLILSLLQAYNNYSINRNSIFLSILLVLVSISGLTHYFVLFSESEIGIAFFYTHFMPLLYLQGPLMYYYVLGTLKDKIIFNWKSILHLIPSLIGFISIFHYYFKPWSFKITIAKQIIASPIAFLKNAQSGNLFINLPARTIIVIAYGIASIIVLFRYCSKNKIELIQLFRMHKSILWLFFITMTIVVSASSYIIMIFNFMIEQMPSRELINQMSMNNITLFSFSLIPIIMLLFPSVLYGMPIIKNLKNNYDKVSNENIEKVLKKTTTIVENKDLIDLAQLIQEFLKTQKPFVDPEFKLDDLAKKLQVPKHHLYYCFNLIFNKKFSVIKKEMRVEYAKELLLKGDLLNQSMEGIWTKAGFSSKTNFFISFKEVTGLTPLEFLKKEQ